MNYRIIRKNELYHHGILGQKWGKRNGPPYPLDASDRSPKEKALNSKSKSSTNKEDEEKHKGLTDSQKKAIKIGAIAAGVALTAAGGYYLYKSGEIDNLIQTGKKFGSNFGSINKIKLKKVETEVADFIVNDMKNVNPLAKNFELNVCQNNCIPSSIISAARFEGLDLQALPNSNGLSFRDIGKYVKGFTPDVLKSDMNPGETMEQMSKRVYNKLCKELIDLAEFNEKDISIGVIGGYDKNTGAQHAFNYAVEKGKVFFFDSKFQIEDCSSYIFEDMDLTKILYGQLNADGFKTDALFEIAKNRV